jgi:hypothetical protein
VLLRKAQLLHHVQLDLRRLELAKNAKVTVPVSAAVA